MMSTKSTLYVSQNLWLETAGFNAHDNVLISAWEAALKEKSKLWSGEAAAAANEDEPAEQESRHIDIGCQNGEFMIARGITCAVKELVTTKLATMVEESLEDILRA